MPTEITGLPSPAVSLNGGAEKTSRQGQREQAPDQNNNVVSPLPSTVSITAASKALKTAEESLGKVPVVDSKRVENVKSALESGHFRVDNERIADKFVQLERALAG